MSSVSAGTTTGTGLVHTSDTTGDLVLKTGASATTAATISGTTQIMTLAQPLPVASGGTGFTAGFSPITASLGADVALNNTANFFDGPSIAQGTVGTWFVSGTVTVIDTTTANALVTAKLWDGTTVIASCTQRIGPAGASGTSSISLSGYITAPAGNLRISCKDGNATSGAILFNNSGLSKDSTITAIRIA